MFEYQQKPQRKTKETDALALKPYCIFVGPLELMKFNYSRWSNHLGGLEHDWIIFPIILGMSSSQLTLTPSLFRGVGQAPTR